MRLMSCLAVLFLFSLVACNKQATTGDGGNQGDRVSPGAPFQQDMDEPPTVRFDLKSSNANPGSAAAHRYECTYAARGKTAKFGLELRYGALESKDPPIAAAEGKFIAVPGSENSALLEDLKAALLAKKLPANGVRVQELPFDAAVLGEHQSENAKGGFSAKPAGDWVAVKLFLPKGGDEGEVFLNINPVLGKGEFSIKDEDYGDYLLREFAKVL